MKNIKIGGNVYQDVEHIHLKDENDQDVMFVDSDMFYNKYPAARFVAILHGNAFTFPLITSNRGTIIAKVKKEA